MARQLETDQVPNDAAPSTGEDEDASNLPSPDNAHAHHANEPPAHDCQATHNLYAAQDNANPHHPDAPFAHDLQATHNEACDPPYHLDDDAALDPPGPVADFQEPLHDAIWDPPLAKLA